MAKKEKKKRVKRWKNYEDEARNVCNENT